MLARRPDNQQGLGSVAIAPTYWRCSIAGAAFTAKQLREWKGAKQLDNTTT